MNENSNLYTETKSVAIFLLKVGVQLISCGAHALRVKTNLNRMAEVWGYRVSIDPTIKGLTITVVNRKNEFDFVTKSSEALSLTVHMAIITEISHLSWNVKNNKLSINEASKIFEEIKQTKKNKTLYTAFAVGISCAGLCILLGGSLANAATAFLGASLGFIGRQLFEGAGFNSMIAIFLAAFISTLIPGLFTYFDLLDNQSTAIATCILYLIPGVFLINGVIDWFEGYYSACFSRMISSLLIILSITLGMSICIAALGVSYFNFNN